MTYFCLHHRFVGILTTHTWYRYVRPYNQHELLIYLYFYVTWTIPNLLADLKYFIDFTIEIILDTYYRETNPILAATNNDPSGLTFFQRSHRLP